MPSKIPLVNLLIFVLPLLFGKTLYAANEEQNSNMTEAKITGSKVTVRIENITVPIFLKPTNSLHPSISLNSTNQQKTQDENEHKNCRDEFWRLEKHADSFEVVTNAQPTKIFEQGSNTSLVIKQPNASSQNKIVINGKELSASDLSICTLQPTLYLPSSSRLEINNSSIISSGSLSLSQVNVNSDQGHIDLNRAQVHQLSAVLSKSARLSSTACELKARLSNHASLHANGLPEEFWQKKDRSKTCTLTINQADSSTTFINGTWDMANLVAKSSSKIISRAKIKDLTLNLSDGVVALFNKQQPPQALRKTISDSVTVVGIK